MPVRPRRRCIASSKRGGSPSSWLVSAFSGDVAPFCRNFSIAAVSCCLISSLRRLNKTCHLIWGLSRGLYDFCYEWRVFVCFVFSCCHDVFSEFLRVLRFLR